ncbi:hypothetical protein [Chitinimonas naiadis]
MDTPLFQQTLDRSRPHELLLEGADPFRCGQLKYRYLDTGSIVLVPNLWYNQTPEMRAQSYEAQAAQLDQLAESMAKRPSNLMVPQEIRDLLAHYKQQAVAFRAQAARFRGEQLRQVEGSKTAPVRETNRQSQNKRVLTNKHAGGRGVAAAVSC